jgi:hypothetical protein
VLAVPLGACDEYDRPGDMDRAYNAGRQPFGSQPSGSYWSVFHQLQPELPD